MNRDPSPRGGETPAATDRRPSTRNGRRPVGTSYAPPRSEVNRSSRLSAEDRPQGYAPVPHALTYDRRLSPLAKVLYAALAHHDWEVGERGKSFDLQEVADRLGMPKTSLYEPIRELRGCGYIVAEYGAGCRYSRLRPAPGAVQAEAVSEPGRAPRRARHGMRPTAPKVPGARQEHTGARATARAHPITLNTFEKPTLTLGVRPGPETPDPTPPTPAPPPRPAAAWDRPDPTAEELAAWEASARTRAGFEAKMLLQGWRQEQARRSAAAAGVDLTPRMASWGPPTAPVEAPRPSDAPKAHVETETLWRRLTTDGSEAAAEAVADRMAERLKDHDWRPWYLKTAKRVQAGELSLKVALRALHASRSATAGDPRKVFTGMVSAAGGRPARA